MISLTYWLSVIQDVIMTALCLPVYSGCWFIVWHGALLQTSSTAVRMESGFAMSDHVMMPVPLHQQWTPLFSGMEPPMLPPAPVYHDPWLGVHPQVPVAQPLAPGLPPAARPLPPGLPLAARPLPPGLPPVARPLPPGLPPAAWPLPTGLPPVARPLPPGLPPDVLHNIALSTSGLFFGLQNMHNY